MYTFDLLNKDGDEQQIQQTKMDKPWREHTEWTEEVGLCTIYVIVIFKKFFTYPKIYHEMKKKYDSPLSNKKNVEKT